jgi:hypothetical protein
VLEADFFMPVAVITPSKKQIKLFEMSDESKEKFKMEKLDSNVVPPIDPELMEDFNKKNYSEIITCDQTDKIVCEAYRIVFQSPLQNKEMLNFQVDMVAHMKNICKNDTNFCR